MLYYRYSSQYHRTHEYVFWRFIEVQKKAENVNLVPIWKDKWGVFALNNGLNKQKGGHEEIVPKKQQCP
jgi:hypothetical protein